MKRNTNTILNRTRAHTCTWLLGVMHVCFVLNHAHNATIKNMPLNDATWSTCDISPIIRFYFWQPIYFNEDGRSFPSDTTEIRGRFVGISKNVGHDMNLKILNTSTNKIISRSAVMHVDDDKSPNLRDGPFTSPELIRETPWLFYHQHCWHYI